MAHFFLWYVSCRISNSAIILNKKAHQYYGYIFKKKCFSYIFLLQIYRLLSELVFSLRVPQRIFVSQKILSTVIIFTNKKIPAFLFEQNFILISYFISNVQARMKEVLTTYISPSRQSLSVLTNPLLRRRWRNNH